ncbi:hypothetical protein VF04_04105 [Nostoc linckia z7]|uniref:Uncharacterized protein n=2 Tax=Nostoc linckia TaxID=92942 RepID=A0A9Q5ZGP1_NOSLI|nr:hypothetical protein [Nostoc linckia]PHK42896.1 hypothetical protein VF12_00805 [Nostoc linckia z15]PHK48053.1 hypothetical protein VF13_01780 [Nostoc linckia z16]PHJ64973.1 hypothetical protein VF02_11590 [Nostoc linckia z1]PHJ70151.1 hypothetical protein VF05_11750 [Nostoc linckia z3]PHJ75052.1 hypothetical protein VF03_11910 [Nostoc linckia z2]
MFQFIDVTEELEQAHQRQLQINRDAPTKSKSQSGDLVVVNTPNFSGMGKVIFTYYVPGYCPHWRVKVDVVNDRYRTIESEESSFQYPY